MRILTSCFLLLFLQLCGNSLLAQGDVKGAVRDTDGSGLYPVDVYLDEDKSISTVTNEKGKYQLNEVPAGAYTIVFRLLGYTEQRREISVEDGKTTDLNMRMGFDDKYLKQVEIEDDKNRDNASTLTIKPQETMVNPSGNFESQLATQALGVSKNNELSSSYSVRGGNFDENLVYVNGFEVYRPFLIRSGQQEGLSFINPDMVESATFSSGGFQAKYGDKMSSVLDVTYKKPQKHSVTLGASLLGTNAHAEGINKDSSFTYLVGFRIKSANYLLGGLQTRGQYSPFFIDLQSYLTYDISPKLELGMITNYAKNRYQFIPVDRETDFGVVNRVLRVNYFYEGSENDRYQSFMNGLSLKWKIRENLRLRFMGSVYRTIEDEAFDIIGEYFIGEVETDLGKEDFDEVRFALGTGLSQDWARNTLDATIYSGAVKGYYFRGDHSVRFGLTYKRENLQDEISEWERLDSAGFIVPIQPDEIELSSVLKTRFNRISNRISGYAQNTWTAGDRVKHSLTTGVRFQYWDVNGEFLVSPRVQYAITPDFKQDIVFTAAGGLYMQPPFWREMRDLNGNVNFDLKAQKSVHAVLGMDWNFTAWKRPFSFTTEAYYKYLWDNVPYEFDNVLIRYFGQNNSRGYATGIDFRLNGELVEDAESWISVSFLKTEEDIRDDFFIQYFDSSGTRVLPSTTVPGQIVDSSVVIPGMLPRPTDMRFSFAMFFQDYIPGNKNFKVHLNLVYASGLPFGPPDQARYNDRFRIPAYIRGDIGFSALLYKRFRKDKEPKPFWKHIESAWMTFEVYNLLGINNTVSYQWVKDFRNTVYAVPNFLTNRRINLRFIMKFGK